jgi:hypothetical protein
MLFQAFASRSGPPSDSIKSLENNRETSKALRLPVLSASDPERSIVKIVELTLGNGTGIESTLTPPIFLSLVFNGSYNLATSSTSVFSGNMSKEIMVDTVVF